MSTQRQATPIYLIRWKIDSSKTTYHLDGTDPTESMHWALQVGRRQYHLNDHTLQAPRVENPGVVGSSSNRYLRWFLGVKKRQLLGYTNLTHKEILQQSYRVFDEWQDMGLTCVDWEDINCRRFVRELLARIKQDDPSANPAGSTQQQAISRIPYQAPFGIPEGGFNDRDPNQLRHLAEWLTQKDFNEGKGSWPLAAPIFLVKRNIDSRPARMVASFLSTRDNPIDSLHWGLEIRGIHYHIRVLPDKTITLDALNMPDHLLVRHGNTGESRDFEGFTRWSDEEILWHCQAIMDEWSGCPGVRPIYDLLAANCQHWATALLSRVVLQEGEIDWVRMPWDFLAPTVLRGIARAHANGGVVP